MKKQVQSHTCGCSSSTCKSFQIKPSETSSRLHYFQVMPCTVGNWLDGDEKAHSPLYGQAAQAAWWG